METDMGAGAYDITTAALALGEIASGEGVQRRVMAESDAPDDRARDTDLFAEGLVQLVRHIVTSEMAAPVARGAARRCAPTLARVPSGDGSATEARSELLALRSTVAAVRRSVGATEHEGTVEAVDRIVRGPWLRAELDGQSDHASLRTRAAHATADLAACIARLDGVAESEAMARALMRVKAALARGTW